jgi:hypothetical protein
VAHLLNLQSGQVEEVPDTEVTARVASGGFTLPNGRVEVVGPAGQRGSIEAADAQDAFSRLGYQWVSPTALQDETLEEKYGDSPGKAFAEGVGRGATLGLSDVALVKSGLVTKEALRERQKRHPVAATTGEITGAIVPAFIPGGQFTAAGAAARVGMAAERAAAAGATSLTGRLAAGAVGGAVENSLWGLGSAISEKALGDSNMTAQKLVGTVGLNAVLGGLGGAAGKGLGHLLGHEADDVAARAVREEAPPAGAANDMPPGAGQAPTAGAANDSPGLSLPDGLPFAPGSGKKLESLAEKHLPRAKQVLEDLGLNFPKSEEWVLRDLDLTKSQTTKLREGGRGALEGLDKSAPRALLEDARYREAKTLGQKLELIRAKQQEAGSAIGDAVKRFDELAEPGLRPNYPDIADKIETEVLAPLRKGSTLNKPIVERLEQEVENLRYRPDTTFSAAEELKRSYDPFLRWDSQTEAPMRDALRKVRGIINGEIESKAEALSTKVADGSFEKWREAKKLYAGMTQLEDMVAKRVDARDVGNRFFSLTDNIHGAAFGAAAGGLNPLGMAAGAAAAVLNKWTRERLPHIIALQLDAFEKQASVRAAAKGLLGFVREETAKGATAAANAAEAAAPGAVGAVAGVAPEAATAAASGPFGRYTEALTRAAAQGPAHLWALHTLLSDADGEYRHIMTGAGLKYDEDEAPHRHRAGALETIEAKVGESDTRLDKAVTALLDKRPKARTGKPLTAEGLRAHADELANLVANPDALTDRLAHATAALGQVAPDTSAALMQAAQRGVAYLHQVAPKAPTPALDVPALRRPWAPSDADVAKFEKRLAAVTDPYSTIEDAAAGRVTREAVEALQAVYPELLGAVRDRLLERLASHGTQLDYQQRLTLGTLFGKPLDDSAQPQRLAALQALHQVPQGPPPSRGGKPPHLAAGFQTDSERLASRRQT